MTFFLDPVSASAETFRPFEYPERPCLILNRGLSSLDSGVLDPRSLCKRVNLRLRKRFRLWFMIRVKGFKPKIQKAAEKVHEERTILDAIFAEIKTTT